MLRVENLVKRYGDKTILDVPALEMNLGIVHLKGINGSGKTTFSKIVAGLIPFQGEVLLNSKLSPVGDKVAYRKMVNYAEPEPKYPEFLTANDLIRFVGKAKGASEASSNALIEKLGISGYLYDHVGTYSSGMLKRLSLCLAFLGNPALILLDEPFNTLDTSAIATLKELIGMNQANGVDFILVSHQDMHEYGITVSSSFLVENHTIHPL
ncbi:MAG: ATP-binding cassette domain-containing protein [Cyclobacteriaceae bacterium]|nr:ATP-binding cassette domain-containing protein [Cyclobacteriaceae bacterium]